MEENKKEKEKEKNKSPTPTFADVPPRKGWMDLLKNYIKEGKRPTKLAQEEETTKLFLEILDEDLKRKTQVILTFQDSFIKNQQILVIYI